MLDTSMYFISATQFQCSRQFFFFWNRVFLTGVSLQVILVGHSSGGACISYALEHHPDKISKAVYLCAAMISDGERPFDVFAAEVFFLKLKIEILAILHSSYEAETPA